MRPLGSGNLVQARGEIQVLAALDHPGIARILDEGIHREGVWYAMELVEGVSPQELNRRRQAGDETDCPAITSDRRGSGPPPAVNIGWALQLVAAGRLPAETE